jgi:hypothetical protein
MLLASTTRRPQHAQINNTTISLSAPHWIPFLASPLRLAAGVSCYDSQLFMVNFIIAADFHVLRIQSPFYGSTWALAVFLAWKIVCGAVWLYMVICTINTYINGSSIQSIVCGIP